MALLIPSLLQAAAFDLAAVNSTSPQPCPAQTTSDVVVCGKRSERYRLPLPIERAEPGATHRSGTGMAALTSPAPCGIFDGQRRCGNAEAAAFGYGEGRDPITVLTKLAKAAASGGD